MSNMYSRNKQRKEQQLLNLRQLTAKTANLLSAADNDHKTSRSPPQSMANRSPSQSSTSSPNQSSKASLVSRSQCRTPKRDISSTNESQQPSVKSETNPNSMLRSVNRSPTSRSQTLRTESRTAGLQSRPTLSPNSRRDASLPHSLSRSSPNSQNKQSLSQIGKNNENPIGVNQRSVKSITDQQIQQKSMSSTLTSTTTTTESTISPEILFLVRQQAKAIAQINALQKKVEVLEHTINGQNMSPFNENSTLEMTCASGSSTKKVVNNNSNTSKERIAISDDSGGEYSRATTTSDDDELSLLLDQIARRSQQLQSTQQISNRFTNLSISSSISGNNNTELLPQTMQSRSKRQPYSTPTAQLSHSTQSPTRDPSVERKAFNYNHISPQKVSPVVQPSAPPLSTQTSQSPYNQSISALLFEPNVENVLKNLDDIIATEGIDSNKFSNASTLSQTYQRSQTSQHSSNSLYDNVNPIVSSGSLLLNSNNGNTSSSASNWQLERAKTLVKQREEREVDKQMRLNEEWLQNQLKTDPKHLRRSNFMDSLEPTFR